MVLVMNIPVATPIVVPVATPIENVAIAVSTGCRCRRLIVSSMSSSAVSPPCFAMRRVAPKLSSSASARAVAAREPCRAASAIWSPVHSTTDCAMMYYPPSSLGSTSPLPWSPQPLCLQLTPIAESRRFLANQLSQLFKANARRFTTREIPRIKATRRRLRGAGNSTKSMPKSESPSKPQCQLAINLTMTTPVLAVLCDSS